MSSQQAPWRYGPRMHGDIAHISDHVIKLLGTPGHLKCGMRVRDLRLHFLGSKYIEHPHPQLNALFDCVIVGMTKRCLIEPFLVTPIESHHNGGTAIGYKLTVDGWIMSERFRQQQREVVCDTA